MSSLSGVSLGGGPSLGRVGGWWDDLTGGSVDPVIGGSSGGDYAKQSPGALPQIPYGSGCPSGMMPDPVNPSQFCVYDAKSQQTAASCPAGTGYDPVTGKCAPKEWGGIQAGQCPAGQTPYNGKCVPVKQCPAGYNYALDKQTCEKSYTTGSTGGGLPAVKPQPVPPEPPPPAESSFPVVPLIAGGLLITAAVLVIRKMKKKQGGYQANEDWEEGYLHVPIPSR
jgi:hypothetical protein